MNNKQILNKLLKAAQKQQRIIKKLASPKLIPITLNGEVIATVSEYIVNDVLEYIKLYIGHRYKSAKIGDQDFIDAKEKQEKERADLARRQWEAMWDAAGRTGGYND